MNHRIPVTTVVLKRLEGGDYYDLNPVVCGDLAEASRSLSRMAQTHPPTPSGLGDRVEVTVTWEHGLSHTFCYLLQPWCGRGCRLDGVLEGNLIWSRDHGVRRASYLLQYADLGQPETELLAA